MIQHLLWWSNSLNCNLAVESDVDCPEITVGGRRKEELIQLLIFPRFLLLFLFVIGGGLTNHLPTCFFFFSKTLGIFVAIVETWLQWLQVSSSQKPWGQQPAVWLGGKSANLGFFCHNDAVPDKPRFNRWESGLLTVSVCCSICGKWKQSERNLAQAE